MNSVMPTTRNILLLAAALLTWHELHADEIASGLAPGKHPLPLQVRDCTGPAAGKTLCYTCRYAERPTTAIFVRGLSPSVAQLAQRIDQQLEQHRDARLAAYLVIVADDSAELEAALKLLAKQQHLRHLPLTILRDRASKLAETYGVSPDAAVTAMHWRDGSVVASRGFATSALSTLEIDNVIADAAKLLD